MLSFRQATEISKEKIKSTRNNKHSETCCKLVNTFCIHKTTLTIQSLTTLKIGELLLRANFPNLSDLTI